MMGSLLLDSSALASILGSTYFRKLPYYTGLYGIICVHIGLGSRGFVRTLNHAP